MSLYLIKSEGCDFDDVADKELELEPELKLDFRPMLVLT